MRNSQTHSYQEVPRNLPTRQRRREIGGCAARSYSIMSIRSWLRTTVRHALAKGQSTEELRAAYEFYRNGRKKRVQYLDGIPISDPTLTQRLSLMYGTSTGRLSTRSWRCSDLPCMVASVSWLSASVPCRSWFTSERNPASAAARGWSRGPWPRCSGNRSKAVAPADSLGQARRLRAGRWRGIMRCLRRLPLVGMFA